MQVYYERASRDRQHYLEELKAYISEIHKGDLVIALHSTHPVLVMVGVW